LPLRDKSDRFRGPLREHYKQTIGEHEAYHYPHDYPKGWVDQQYLPEGIEGEWFKLKGHGYEKVILRRLQQMREQSEKEK
jgi:putative ATPase